MASSELKIKMSASPPINKLVLLILSLCIYIIVTFTSFTYMNKLFHGSTIVSSDTQQLMDMPMLDDGVDTTSYEADDGVDTTSYEANNVTEGYVCDAQNSPDFLPDGDVIKRALHAVIIGTQKGGTQALHKILVSDNRILTSGKGHGELHFFNNIGLKRNLPDGNPAKSTVYDRRIPRQDIRDGFEYILKDRTAMNSRRNGTYDITNERNANKYGIHSAPIYLFSGRSVPARMLCVAPWIHVLAILRNPINRALSHYNFVKSWNGNGHKYKGERPSFEKYIQDDIVLLRKAGVLQNWKQTNFESFSGSTEEFAAWERYIVHAKMAGPVGRGLYAIQLEIWMDEFKKINKSIENDLLVLQSEDTKENPKDAHDRSLQFLGLAPPRKVKRHVLHKVHHQTKYTHPGISNKTYNLLYNLYKPYNKRLYRLLGEDTWGGVWDDDE